MTESAPAIVWFRQDLRLADNPALTAAAGTGAPVLCVYILDEAAAGDRAMGAASRWWLHRSLARLDEALDGRLLLLAGDAAELLPELVAETGSRQVFWNRCYEPWRRRRDKALRRALQEKDVEVRTFNGSLLFEPTDIAKEDGGPYRVFTPFWKKGCLESGPTPREPLPTPGDVQFTRHDGGVALDALGLLPDIKWYDGMDAAWTPGEAGARERLERFLDEGLKGYKEGRNRPDQEHVSRLSPHLHFGEVSPQQVWQALDGVDRRRQVDDDLKHFRSELGWREFSYHLLYHWPEIVSDNLQKKFNRFPWRDDEEALTAWQRGRTGYPIVDAGMRELWQTGYMHNRVRMIVGSFLVKNLLLHWHHGERWFWDTLCDADLANNCASWQWVAGSGADAAPYFRIFNPVLQGKKFDPNGDYVRRYVPELAALPDKYLQAPWEAPQQVLQDAGVRLGRDYPEPVVDLKSSRERALEAFKRLTPED